MYGPQIWMPHRQIASIQNGPYCRGQLAVLGRLIAELGGHFVRFVQGSIFPRFVDKGSSVLVEIHALCDWEIVVEVSGEMPSLLWLRYIIAA